MLARQASKRSAERVWHVSKVVLGRALAAGCIAKFRRRKTQGPAGQSRTARVLLSPPARNYTRADRKSTRLNSSHSQISYAVFCLKKKKTQHRQTACSAW